MMEAPDISRKLWQETAIWIE